MENLLGKIEAVLSEKEIQVSDELVFLINTRIKPPLRVKKEDINIRAMYLVSDEVNSFGGCFPLSEHPILAELLVDSPVLIGHSREKLPIARNFKADLVKKDGANWIKVYFYWLKNTPEANSLKDNIDHGIYKECSIGFSFEFPECSVCGQDMRKCPHIPFRTYEKESGEKVRAYYNYRNIIRVYETSLVYRGAVFGTSITNELELFQKHECADGICKYKRIYKESILESLKKAGLEKEADLSGEIMKEGYTEDKIRITCEKNSEQKILGSLPGVFRDRVIFTRKKTRFIPTSFILQNQIRDDAKDCLISFENGKNLSVLHLYRFDLDLLDKGKRFLCDFSEKVESVNPLDDRARTLDRGKCKMQKESESIIRLEFEGEILKAGFLLRKIHLKGRERWLFYKRKE
ncbi:MAG: hypothetical protein OEV55_03470 [candidate division Zixibacteria bacterium]|nr:hypothetical protein [candidate division Zixibacteria bacterium]